MIGIAPMPTYKPKKQAKEESYPLPRQEHDEIMREIGSPNEGYGQEHQEIMDAIMERED